MIIIFRRRFDAFFYFASCIYFDVKPAQNYFDCNKYRPVAAISPLLYIFSPSRGNNSQYVVILHDRSSCFIFSHIYSLWAMPYDVSSLYITTTFPITALFWCPCTIPLSLFSHLLLWNFPCLQSKGHHTDILLFPSMPRLASAPLPHHQIKFPKNTLKVLDMTNSLIR